MKRHGYLLDDIASYSNIWAAFEAARKAKRYRNPELIARVERDFDIHAGDMIADMQYGTYATSPYTTFALRERGKERLIHRLPFWPDRVAHHAIARVLSPMWRSTLITDTSSSIPGRGVRFACGRVRDWVRHDPAGTAYCLQMDVRKFYPTIDHDLMVNILGRKIKDPAVMRLLDEIVRSADVTAPGVGLPIGNYLSQWFANLYLSALDHKLTAEPGAAHYHRYCDDVIVFSGDKDYLHDLRARTERWLADERRLELKPNWQVFPITHRRGLDFAGYVFYRNRTLLRKATKKRMITAIRKRQHDPLRLAPIVGAYNGWTSFGSTHNLHGTFIAPNQRRLAHAY